MSKPKRAVESWQESRFTKYVPCELDLAPSFATSDGKTYRELGLERGEGGYARVAVFQLYGPETAIDKKSSLWRVCVWGADDTGYECDVPSMTEALTIFNKVDWIYGVPAEFHYA